MPNNTTTMAACKHCGRPFQAHAHGRFPLYCSASCRTAAYRERRMQMTEEHDGLPYTCPQCGKTFYWHRTGTRPERPQYCSKLCYDLAYGQREKQRLKQYQHDYYIRRKAKKVALANAPTEPNTNKP